MDMHDKKWLGGGADVAVRAAFSLGMCGALAAVLYVTAQNGMADSASSQRSTQTATLIATLDSEPAALQLAIDASPAFSLPAARAVKPMITSVEAYDVVPTRRPDPRDKSQVASSNASVAERFDKCLPDCETRDPMVVNSNQVQHQPFDPDPATDTLVAEPVSLPASVTLLDRALDAPGAAFRKGRSVIKTIVNASL